jgi:hypothetical protein
MVPMGESLVCQSCLWDDDSCDFSVPLNFSAEQLYDAAEKRISELKKEAMR